MGFIVMSLPALDRMLSSFGVDFVVLLRRMTKSNRFGSS